MIARRVLTTRPSRRSGRPPATAVICGRESQARLRPRVQVEALRGQLTCGLPQRSAYPCVCRPGVGPIAAQGPERNCPTPSCYPAFASGKG